MLFFELRDEVASVELPHLLHVLLVSLSTPPVAALGAGGHLIEELLNCRVGAVAVDEELKIGRWAEGEPTIPSFPTFLEQPEAAGDIEDVSGRQLGLVLQERFLVVGGADEDQFFQVAAKASLHDEAAGVSVLLPPSKHHGDAYVCHVGKR